MTFSGHIVIDHNGGMRLTRAEPALSRNERSVKIELTVPGALFRTPTLRANVVIGDDVIPSAVTAETIAEIREAVQSASDLVIKVVPVEDT